MSSGPGQRAWNRPGVGGGAAAAASAGWKIEQRSPGAWAAPGGGAEVLRAGGGAYAGWGACVAASAISGLGGRGLDVGGETCLL